MVFTPFHIFIVQCITTVMVVLLSQWNKIGIQFGIFCDDLRPLYTYRISTNSFKSWKFHIKSIHFWNSVFSVDENKALQLISVGASYSERRSLRNYPFLCKWKMIKSYDNTAILTAREIPALMKTGSMQLGQGMGL